MTHLPDGVVCRAYWDPADETACHWADPALEIPWPATDAALSPRDAAAGGLHDLAEEYRRRAGLLTDDPQADDLYRIGTVATILQLLKLPDGTVIWTSPSGQTYTTHPGSRLLFPTLCLPTAPVVLTGDPPTPNTGLTMPRRKRTRTQDRARRINAERHHNEATAAAQCDATPPF